MTLQRISESVFVGLCYKVGTSQQVAIRRDIIDIKELLEYNVARTGKEVLMLSGSRREGFRLKTSDIDVMYWSNDHPVLWDFSQAQFYNTRRDTLILCESTESPPGFTLLSLPLERATCGLLAACIRINGALYISSAKFRDFTCSVAFPDSTVHGPCSSRGGVGSMEYDYAHCFVSDFWPPLASSWIDRCHSWPLPCIVDDIIRSGCHFVAIGHKQGNHTNNEWRISFSQAEQKLVYSMNHTQFLTYGLLKLFVKDFNNGLSEEEKLLCSYHMKTTIFWVIQQKTIDWCPQNLLDAFWICFKLLLKWVYEGVCPNFFIPENNMFLNKVHGNAQSSLFTSLYGMYEKGISFLLQCPSISFYVMDVICNPRLSLCTNDQSLISHAMIEDCLLLETSCTILYSENILNCMEYLHAAEQLINFCLTQYQITMLQKFTATFLQTSALTLHETCTNTSGVNKHMYIADKMSCFMLKLAAKFGFVSDLLFVAMYHYKTLRYSAALSVIETTKVKLEHARIMYGRHEDPERYNRVVGGQSLSRKIRQVVPPFIILQNNICFINELTLEQQSASQNKQSMLYIPPFILLYMLEFLCCRHVDLTKAQRALYDLQDLVHNGPGVLIPVPLRGISWEILGICQELAGDYQAALYSYHQSLRQPPFNSIQTATRHRIRSLSFPVT
ncbi:uncharacterized protein LOC144621105 [Crassostrea virginica]